MNRPLQSDVSDEKQIANFADRSNERGQTLLRKAGGRSSELCATNNVSLVKCAFKSALKVLLKHFTGIGPPSEMTLPGIDQMWPGCEFSCLQESLASGARLGYLDSITGVCQPIDLLTQTFQSGSKLPILLSEPAESAVLVISR